jgi:restriction endonuclease S subunit
LDRETAEIDAAVADLDRYVELQESRKIEKLKELIFADNEGEFPLIPVQLLFRKISSGSTPKGEHFYAESGNGVPWVTTSELREKIITETKKNVTPQAVEKVSGLVVFPRDTILIAMYGATIGRFGRLGVNATSNQACCALIDPIGIDPEFFYYSLYVHSRELVKQAFGGGQPNINQDTIRRFRAPVPSLAKQKKIAREMKIMVAETEDIIAESTKLRDLLMKRRSVLITEAVTGRKQV